MVIVFLYILHSLFYYKYLWLFLVYVQEKIGSWYSNPGTGADAEGSGGGVGKYLKARTTKVDSTSVPDGNAAVKKRKVSVSTQLQDFSAW